MESLITSKEAERILGLSPGTLAVMRCRKTPNQPPYVKVGRAVRYALSVLYQWIKDNTVGGEK